MKTATVQDLRYDFPKIEAWLAGGEEILITKHAKPADSGFGVTAFLRRRRWTKCALRNGGTVSVYPDTSFLCAIYREQDHSEKADAYRETLTAPLPFTSLLEFEFIQAIRLQIFPHKSDRTRGYTARAADQMIADWEADIAAGLNVLVPADADAVLRLSRTYSLQHTASGGHRTLDILHVATAVHLGASTFLTFDERQRKLAHHAGLKLPL